MVQYMKRPGARFTREARLADLLMAQEAAAPPIKSHTQGIASMLRQGMSGFMMGQDDRKRTAASAAMARGMGAQPWVNPDTGQVSTAPAGGLAGAEAALAGMADNPYAARVLSSLLLQRGARDEDRTYKAGLAKTARDQALTDAELAHKRAVKIKELEMQGKKPATGMVPDGNGGWIMDRDYALHKINVARMSWGLPALDELPAAYPGGAGAQTPPAPPGAPQAAPGPVPSPLAAAPSAPPIVAPAAAQPLPAQPLPAQAPPAAPAAPAPGSRADLAQRRVDAQMESNRLREQAMSPEYQQRTVQIKKEAEAAVKKQQAMPGKQSQIVSMMNSTAMFDEAIDDAIALGHGSLTGGNIGTFTGLSKSSDQAKMERKLLTIRGIVGLDELVYRKEHGATFGALSDTEMQLLSAALGAFSGDMEGPELDAALTQVKRLHRLNLDEKKRAFAVAYPNADRPWEAPATTAIPSDLVPIGGF